MQDDIAKPREEKENGEMDKPGSSLRHHWHEFETFGQKRLNARSPQGVFRPVVNAEIRSSPLLNDRRK